jgi:raffinose/stachyose/melibiose transport system substrate-binding protein
MGEAGQKLFLGDVDAEEAAQIVQDGLSAWWTPGE